MPRKKHDQERYRSLIKLGVGKGSIAVTIPRSIVEKYGWEKGQEVTLDDQGKGVIVLRASRRRKSVGKAS